MQYNDFNSFDCHNFDEYLHDPDIPISTMIEKYNINLSRNQDKDEKRIEKKSLKCVVCGGKAFGFNFGQITCESCKAFFRRNALRDMSGFQCRFGGNCNITVDSRRHCTHCRITKCFLVGMKKEWIRSEQEKLVKNIDLEKNRKIKLIKQSAQISLYRQPEYYNSKNILSSTQKIHLNNVTNCYEKYTGEPCVSQYRAPLDILSLRLHDFYNRKKPIVISFISYFKHLPEFEQLNIDDQVLLVKQNIRILLPINYALLKTPSHSQFRYTQVRTVHCLDNINLHSIYQSLSNSFVPYVTYDSLMMKLLLIALFFATNTQFLNSDTYEYKQHDYIKRIQTNYIELLWFYMIEKMGERSSIIMLTKLTTKLITLQKVTSDIDTVVRLNNDIEQLDSLMKTILQLN